MPVLVDRRDKVFGIQLVKEYTGAGYWLVECTNCFCLTRKTNLTSKSGCRNCLGLPKGGSGLRRLWVDYRRHARYSKREFVLTLEQFREITSQHCHYCGAMPSQVFGNNFYKDYKQSTWGDYTYNGVDRVDNAVGYLCKNCVSCCGTCNKAKGKKDYTEFVAWLDRIASFRKKL